MHNLAKFKKEYEKECNRYTNYLLSFNIESESKFYFIELCRLLSIRKDLHLSVEFAMDNTLLLEAHESFNRSVYIEIYFNTKNTKSSVVILKYINEKKYLSVSYKNKSEKKIMDLIRIAL